MAEHIKNQAARFQYTAQNPTQQAKTFCKTLPIIVHGN